MVRSSCKNLSFAGVLCLLLVCLAGTSLAEVKKQAPDKPLLVFAQGQMWYPLCPQFNNRCYFSEWVDWPLGIDNRLCEEGVVYTNLQYPDYVRQQEQMQLYGLTGCGLFPDRFDRGWIPNLATFSERSAKPGFMLLPVVYDGGKPEDLRHVLVSPTFQTWNGKKIIYGHRWGTDENFNAFREKVEKLYPGQFLFVMNKYIPHKFRDYCLPGKTLPPECREEWKEEVRKSLRLFDGFGWHDFCSLIKFEKDRRVFHYGALRQGLAIAREVFEEEEFRGKGKIFASEGLVGHENASWVGYCCSSDGTLVLRSTLIEAINAGVDLINIAEWDEQNENTSLRPTVYNGSAHTRIVRYILLNAKGEKVFSLPGDNLGVPNLIVSARKIITLGEKLVFELLNVPDRAGDNGEYTVRLGLKNHLGTMVHRFEPVQMRAGELCEYRPEIPSEQFSCERVLVPVVEIEQNGVVSIWEQGFAAVQIQPTWNFDYKWVKQPLRDLMPPPKLDFAATEIASNGLGRLKAEVTSQRELDFVEALDNGDCIFSVPGGEMPWRDLGGDPVFRVCVETVVTQKVSGEVRLEGTSAQMTGFKKGTKPAWPYKDKMLTYWHHAGYATIPQGELDSAVFVVDFPGICTERIPAREVYEKQNIVVGGNKGFNVAIGRQLRQYLHPDNLRSKTAAFDVPFSPDLPVSVLQLQLLGSDGSLWRSKPLLSAEPSSRRVKVTVFSETASRPITVEVPANFVPPLEYDWSDSCGLLVATSAGRTLCGVRGGFMDLATQRVGGYNNSENGTPPCNPGAQVMWGNCGDLAPRLEKQPDGKYALCFTGNREYVALPTGTVPRRSGFVISFQVMPEDCKPLQFLLANSRGNAPGLLEAVTLQNGTLHATVKNNFFRTFKFDTHQKLNAGEWNTVEVHYDQSKLWFVVNGEVGKALEAPGPGPYDMPLQIGTWGNSPFKGKIRDFTVRHFEP